MTLQEAIEKKLSRLSSVPDAFLNSITKTEKEFWGKVLAMVSKLDIADGRFVLSKSNLAKLSEIESQLKNVFLETDFKEQVKKFLTEFDKQAELTNLYFKKIAKEQIPISLLDKDYELLKANKSDALFDIAQGLNFKGNQLTSGYSRQDNIIIRVKDHTPDWDYFRSDIEDGGVKKIINITVGDFDNSDYRRSKGELEKLKKEFPDIEFIDVKVSEGESINSSIKKIADSFSGFEPTKIADELLKKKKESVAKLLLGDNLDAEFINPIKAQVELAVTSQATFSETLDGLQKIVTGDANVDSKIRQYSKQIAGDSFAISDRAYTKVISDDLGAEWFKWSGNIIPTSRSICVDNHNKFFHRKEIEAMAENEWSGKMEGTNSETIFVTAGGYGPCRHSILPVSINSVPADVIERAEKKGFYVPA